MWPAVAGVDSSWSAAPWSRPPQKPRLEPYMQQLAERKVVDLIVERIGGLGVTSLRDVEPADEYWHRTRGMAEGVSECVAPGVGERHVFERRPFCRVEIGGRGVGDCQQGDLRHALRNVQGLGDLLFATHQVV